MTDLIHQVEAILFSIGKKVDVEYIRKLCRVKDVAIVVEALEELKKNYDTTESSLQVIQEGEQGELWKLTVREKYSNLVRKIVPETEMTKTVMETLAVIAWKQPIIQSDVIKIRTNKAYEHIKQLQEMGFVTSQRFGRTKKLKLTQKFLDYFDLKGIDDIKELFKQMREKEAADNPPEDGKGAEVARLVDGIRQAVEDQSLVSNAIEDREAQDADDSENGMGEDTGEKLETYDSSSQTEEETSEEKEESEETSQEFSTDEQSESSKEINQMMSADLSGDGHKHTVGEEVNDNSESPNDDSYDNADSFDSENSEDSSSDDLNESESEEPANEEPEKTEAGSGDNSDSSFYSEPDKVEPEKKQEFSDQIESDLDEADSEVTEPAEDSEGELSESDEEDENKLSQTDSFEDIPDTEER